MTKICRQPNKVRVVAFRSNQEIYAQAVDNQGKTICSYSSMKVEGTTSPIQKAFVVGQKLAEQLKKNSIKKICFDRNGYRYHGRVKSLAEGIRKGGILF